MVQSHNFLGLLIIYLALQHCLQNPNTAFQYRDMSHKMTWYILAHMPYFRRRSHIYYRTLCGRDQREKCALNALKHTFQANSALLTTKSALTVQ